MRISSKGEYGLRALFDLAQHVGEGPIQSDDIAPRQGIPVNYLNQLLITLRRAGIIDSLRGPLGGHRLAHPPEAITLHDILTALEGPILPSEAGRDQRTPTAPEDSALLEETWTQVRAQVEQALAAITLDDLRQRKQQQHAELMYHI
jgi:Rrf2 family transcriptional regulator, cysteine metabolism repressor